jgi:hypothetical protein
MTLITGNTYPVRQKMHDLGGVWNAAAKGWDMPDAKAEEARAIVAAAGPKTPLYKRPRYRRDYSRGSYSGTGYTRFSSGAEMYQNPRGRCEDAPCCGCCS